MSTCGYRTQAPVSRGSESFSKGAVVLTDYLTCRSYSVAHPKDEIRPQPLMFNVVAKILLLPLCCTPPADMRTSFSHRPRCKSQVRASKPQTPRAHSASAVVFATAARRRGRQKHRARQLTNDSPRAPRARPNFEAPKAIVSPATVARRGASSWFGPSSALLSAMAADRVKPSWPGPRVWLGVFEPRTGGPRHEVLILSVDGPIEPIDALLRRQRVFLTFSPSIEPYY